MSAEESKAIEPESPEKDGSPEKDTDLEDEGDDDDNSSQWSDMTTTDDDEEESEEPKNPKIQFKVKNIEEGKEETDDDLKIDIKSSPKR